VTLGEPVVLDASWTDARWRRAVAELARETTSDFVELQCTAPADLAATRMARRARTGADASDATPEVASAMASVADAWPSAVQIDTSGTPEQSLERALAVVGSPTGG
jgi:predicted kinase